MTDSISSGAHHRAAAHPRSAWVIRIGAIGWFVGILAFLLALPVLWQATPWSILAVIALAALLALLLAWLLQLVLKPRHPFRPLWIKCAVALTFLLSAIVAAPFYYFSAITQLRPSLVPQATLTNGQKTIIFQGMEHIGMEPFYKSVVYDLEDALSKGYVFYFEGVKPSTPPDEVWLDTLVSGGQDLDAFYKGFSQLCGLHFQNDYFQLVARDALVHPDMHVNADVSTHDMRVEYDRLMASDAAFATAIKARRADSQDTASLSKAIDYLTHGTEGQKDLAGVLCRGILSGSGFGGDSKAKPDPLDRVILDYRNRELTAQLLAEPRHHIYVTYGSAHLPGVLALLRKSDPKWRVASLKWMRTIDAPESYERTLPGVSDLISTPKGADRP